MSFGSSGFGAGTPFAPKKPAKPRSRFGTLLGDPPPEAAPDPFGSRTEAAPWTVPPSAGAGAGAGASGDRTGFGPGFDPNAGRKKKKATAKAPPKPVLFGLIDDDVEPVGTLSSAHTETAPSIR